MEPNDQPADKTTETPESEQDQGIQVGDAAPLESEAEQSGELDGGDIEVAAEKDESMLSLEERNIRNSPNIAAPTTGPTEEEIAEKKHEEEIEKLDELKPIVNETLIDDGKSMERKKRRPLVIAFIVIAVLVIAGVAGVMFYTNQKKPQKDIPAPVITYTDEVKVGVDARLKSAFDEVSSNISNFEAITATTPENNVFSTELLTKKEYDLLLTADYEANIVDPGEDPTYVSVNKTPFLNDAIVAIVNQDATVDELTSAQIADIVSGKAVYWTDLTGESTTDGEEGEEVIPTEPAPINLSFMVDGYFERDLFSATGQQPSSAVLEKGTEESISFFVSKVNEDKYSIAFVRRSDLTEEMTDKVKIIKIDTIAASDETIADASYPLTLKYFIIASRNLEDESVSDMYRKALLDTSFTPNGFVRPSVADEGVDCEDAETDCVE